MAAPYQDRAKPELLTTLDMPGASMRRTFLNGKPGPYLSWGGFYASGMYEGKFYAIKLSAADVGQLMDGLELRAQAWEKTAEYHRTGVSPSDFVVEECNSAEEAERIAKRYRSIIATIIQQTEHQP